MDVSDFAVDSLATILGAIRSGQNEPATFRQPSKGPGGKGRWIDELSNGMLLKRYPEVYTRSGLWKRHVGPAHGSVTYYLFLCHGAALRVTNRLIGLKLQGISEVQQTEGVR